MLLLCLSLLTALTVISASSVVDAPAPSNSSAGKVRSAWYPGWETLSFPIGSIPWDRYTQVTYSFAETTPDVNTLSLLDGSKEPSLPIFVSAAHASGVHALVSVGGWTGSRYFSTAVGSAANRTAFVQTILNMVSKYDLDGFDIDWEYPNHQGIGCNIINANDTANLLSFLQELRQDPAGAKLIVTAATGLAVFAGSDGNPMTDVSEFAKVLTYVAIMNYDVNGQWSDVVGPNAPIYDWCSSDRPGAAAPAVAAWTAAKFPANQLLLGTAAYGHPFNVTPSNALDALGQIKLNPPFTKDTKVIGIDVCGNPTFAGPDLFTYADLINGGYLNTNGSAAEGIHYTFDECSKTPYVYSSETQFMISFDNAESFALKGQFILEKGLAGFSTWDVTGDYKNTLVDSITTVLDGSSDC